MAIDNDEVLQKCIDDGHKPDLVVVDYIDYVRPPKNSRIANKF